MSAIVNGKRKPKPDTWHSILRKLASSPLLDTPLSTLIHWKAVDDYGPEAVPTGHILSAEDDEVTGAHLTVPGDYHVGQLPVRGWVAKQPPEPNSAPWQAVKHLPVLLLPNMLASHSFVLYMADDSALPQFPKNAWLIVRSLEAADGLQATEGNAYTNGRLIHLDGPAGYAVTADETTPGRYWLSRFSASEGEETTRPTTAVGEVVAYQKLFIPVESLLTTPTPVSASRSL